MESLVIKAGLGDILDKVKNGERISKEEGVRLYECPDLLAVGYLANMVRERKNGDKAYFIYNQHLNYSNICTNLCKFCAFGKEKGTDKSYEMSVDEAIDKIRDRLDEPITEVHMVGGIHPDLPFSYYTDILKGIKEVRPDIHIQAFTCVEIDHLAKLAEKTSATIVVRNGIGSDRFGDRFDQTETRLLSS